MSSSKNSKLISAICLIFCASASFSSILTSKMLLNLQEERIKDFKVQLQHTLEGARIRRKRQHGQLATLPDPGGFTAEHFRVGNSAPQDLPYLFQYNLTTWTSFRHFDRNHILIGTSHGDLILLDVTNGEKFAEVMAYNPNEMIIQKARAFSYYKEQWFIFQSLGAPAEIQLYQRVGRGLEQRQTIPVSGDFDFDFIEVHGARYLVVAVYRTWTNQGFTYQGSVLLYHWTHTQFDFIAAETVQGAKSLACWTIDRTLYIAIGQEINDQGNMFLGSPVFLFNAKDAASLILQDKLQTKGPSKAAHFSLGGSDYLIFIGHYDAEIYWWSNGQFLSWQTIYGSANASDVSALLLSNGEVVLVVVLKEEVLFLTLDSTGHYIISFTMKFTGFNIKSLQFMFDGRDYYALVLFAASIRTHPHPIWKLKLEKYGLPDLTAIDPLIQCLSDLKDKSNEQQNEFETLQDALNSVWVTNKEQIIVTEVVVQGSISSEKNILIDEMLINSNITEVSRPKDISSGILDITESGTFMNEQLTNVIYKTKEQNILGKKFFSGLLLLPTLNIHSPDYDLTINGVTVSRLSTKVLKKNGNQVIDTILKVNAVFVDEMMTGLLNNINLNDMVLLNGYNNITGALAFSNMQVTDIKTESLNSVHMSNLVLKSRDQIITELKSMKLLNSHSINVMEQTNGEYLKTLQQKIFDLDNYQELKGRYDFKSLVYINDLLVNTPINGNIDVDKISLEAVRINESQVIKGHKIFSTPNVLGNLEVTGFVNDIDINGLATLSTEQTLTGNLFFKSAVTFQDHIFADAVNDIDLYEVAIKRNGSTEVVSDMKNFQSVSVNNIEVLDFATINDIDISIFAASVVKHKDGVVKSKQSTFDDVIVLANLTASNGINGYDVFDLPKIVWLKSEEQNIEIPVSFPNPVFHKTELEVETMNGIDFDGFIHIAGDEIVQAETTFDQHVYVIKNASIVDGKLLDDVNLHSFREENIAHKLLVSEDSVYGNKRFKNLEIKGHIDISNINSLNFANNFLLANKKQKLDGAKIFTSLIVDGDATAKNIDIDILNGENLKSFFGQAVLRDHITKKIMDNKTFLHLRADDLTLSGTSKVGGILMSEMILRTISVNNAQYVPGPKVYKSLHFSKQTIIGTLNGMDFDSHANKVVFMDDTVIILGRKSFKSFASTINLKVKGYINGINISMLEHEVFSKSKVNYINFMMFFGGDLDIASLQVYGSALIDNVQLNSTAHLDEFRNPVWILSDVQVQGDVFVFRLTNGCDLIDVGNNALQKNKSLPQTVTSEWFLNKLDIQGNIHFQKTLNDISLEKLKESLIGNGRYDFLSGDFHIQSGIFATHLQVIGFLNGIDLTFVIDDAMLNSVSQIIRGFKLFDKDLEAEVLIGRDVYVQNTMNDVHIKDVFDKTVWNDEFQVLEGDKVFGHIKAKNISVYGSINGIKFPNDVVMTAVSEHISSSVFMKDVHVNLHLHVNGSIGGVNLKEMLEDVIWLDLDEDVLSRLIFFHDIIINGELNIDGMLNNIILEMAMHTKGNTVVDGSKVFFNDFIVLENVDVQSINRYNLRQLLHSVARLNRNETISNVQVFTEPIYSQNSISTNYINGLFVSNFKNDFLEKFNGMMVTITLLSQLRKSNDKRLTYQQESLPYQVTSFAYFVAVQELSIGSTNRILTGFQHKTNTVMYWESFVSWTSESNCQQKQSMCCDLEYSYWLKFDQYGSFKVESGPERGRYLPLPNSLTTSNQLIVWTNTTSPWMTWCNHLGMEETAIGWLNEKGLLKVSLIVKYSPSLVDVKAFRDGFTYVVAGYHFDNRNGEYSASIVYRGNELKDNWNEHQILPVYGILSMDLITYKTQTLLAFGTGMGTYPDSHSSVYIWNGTNRMFELLENIPSQYASSVLWIYQGKQLLLAIAGVDNFEGSTTYGCSSKTDGGQINIYSYSNGLSWIQSLRLSDVVSMVSFEIKGETYLVAASRLAPSITIFQWQGYSRFVLLQTIEARGASHLNYFWKNEDLYLSVASSGVTRILKAVIRGNQLKTLTYDDDKSASELGDEPSHNNLPVSLC